MASPYSVLPQTMVPTEDRPPGVWLPAIVLGSARPTLSRDPPTSLLLAELAQGGQGAVWLRSADKPLGPGWVLLMSLPALSSTQSPASFSQ